MSDSDGDVSEAVSDGGDVDLKSDTVIEEEACSLVCVCVCDAARILVASLSILAIRDSFLPSCVHHSSLRDCSFLPPVVQFPNNKMNSCVLHSHGICLCIMFMSVGQPASGPTLSLNGFLNLFYVFILATQIWVLKPLSVGL